MLIKCPHDGATMELDEGIHTCPECETTMSLAEAEELFESGEVVALVEDEVELVEDYTDKLSVMLSEYSVVSKILRAGKKGTMSEEYMSDLVESLVEDTDINFHKVDISIVTEWAETLIAESAVVSEDLVTALAGEDTLSEESKSDVVVVFEAALNVRAKQIKEHQANLYDLKLAEAEEEIRESIESEVDGYLDVVVTEWMAENKIAVEAGMKVEMTESFLEGLQELFAEHYVDIPEGKEDVLESLVDQISELESSIDEMKKDEAAVMVKIVEMKQDAAFKEVAKDLAETSKEKLAELAESVEFVEEDAYKAKLLKLKESFLSESNVVVEDTGVIVEKGVLDESESESTDSQFDYITEAVKALKSNQ